MTLSAGVRQLCARLGLSEESGALAIGSTVVHGGGGELVKLSPIDGTELARFPSATPSQVARGIEAAAEAFRTWRTVPGPARGELVRRFADALRKNKADLAQMITLEVGKTTSEAEGEVQEMIDICEFAVGLSRQLYGLTIQSERPEHRLMEQWHPLGPVGVISAFNFPVAVWSWNAALALVCGDPVVWKPSEKAPLSALACHAVLQSVVENYDYAPNALSMVAIGGADAGGVLAASRVLPLVSATGSVPMGRAVAKQVAGRLGRSLLELGGNNGLIVTPSADLELALKAITFAAVGTAGQRCTSLRRLIVHESIKDVLVARLKRTYASLTIGDPQAPGVLLGPLIDDMAVQAMTRALDVARNEGGIVFGGLPITDEVPEGGHYVAPALVEINPTAAVIREETFAPILYVMPYTDLNEAIAVHNAVPQGLSSAIFTTDVREAELFCGPSGSDCGIVNVNIGTSGAEIGGAFGGEKDSGGGRESGTDAWKNYMRRVTNTINYGTALPLAQGVRFE